MKNLLDEQKLEVLSKEIFANTMTMRDQKYATLVGINFNDKDNLIYQEIGKHGDIYNLLSNTPQNPSKLEGFDLLAVLTAGWAAPVNGDEDDNIQPSMHKDRRRVYLALVGNTSNQTSSIIQFSDNDEMIYENGSGALQEAFEEMLKEIGW